ncbi:hypothetical protein AB0M79_35195 [Polymorphospora sp. NPDC051019]|uniref:hypothetical protein n=1 Tax=Polymorphospora sp. NPDC051019 TaxID=3155725 RepID=UPI0034435318
MASSTLAAIAVAATLGLSPSTAHANPTSNFSGSVAYGYSAGTFIWYNRSLGIQGEVCDYAGSGSTQVRFAFHQGSNYLGDDGYPDQTRTATGECRSFNFTQSGPVGGITHVQAWLYNGSSYTSIGVYSRP